MWRRKSYEILPALQVRGAALRQSLRTVTVAWMFGVVWMACVSGSQIINWCWLLGFEDWHFGLLGALSFAAVIAQLFAAVSIERTGLRKYRFIFCASLHRLLWLSLALAPLALGPPSGRAVAVFLVLWGLSSALAQFAIPPWQTWMGDLIPRRVRARYFAARNLWTVPINIAVTGAAALLLDRVMVASMPPVAHAPAAAAVAGASSAVGPLTGLAGAVAYAAAPLPAPIAPWAQPRLMAVLAILFVVAGIFGTVDILLFLRMREIASPRSGLAAPAGAGARRPLAGGGHWARRAQTWAGGLLADLFVEPFRQIGQAFGDRVFRHYSLYGVVVTFSMTVGGNYFWTNVLRNLGYSNLGANMVFLVCGAVAVLIFGPLWGRIIDRWGRKPVLIIGTLGTVTGPVGWLLVAPGELFWNYLFGGLITFSSAAMWIGVELSMTSTVLGFAQASGRSKLVASAAVINAAGGFLGGLVGAQLTKSLAFLQASPLRWGPLVWTSYHFTFLAAAAARGASVLFLLGMPEPGAKPVRHVLRQVFFSPYNNVMSRLFGPLRPRQRRRPPPDDRRTGAP